MADYNIARVLSVCIRFDDLDPILRSHIYQRHKLQIVSRFLCTVVSWCLVATHIKKIKLSVLCVTGVYLRHITNVIFVILHLNVRHQSVCFSCFIIVFRMLHYPQELFNGVP